MNAAAWLKAALLAATLGGCGPTLAVRGSDGLALLTVKRGACFVGCNLQIRTVEGKRCRGHAPGISAGYPLNGLIYCPDQPQQRLRSGPLQQGLAVPGTLDGAPVVVTLR